jgi:HEAT repeat protein
MLLDRVGAQSDVFKLLAAIREAASLVETEGPPLVRSGIGWVVQGLARALAGEAPRNGWRASDSSGPWIPSIESVRQSVMHTAAKRLAKVDRLDDAGLMINALQDESGATREAVATAFSHIQDVRVVEPLLAALTDSIARVRFLAARGLAGRYADTRIDESLSAALKRQDLAVVAGGCVVTVPLGATDFAETIVSALRKFDDGPLARQMRQSTNELLRQHGEAWVREHRDQPSHLASSPNRSPWGRPS